MIFRSSLLLLPLVMIFAPGSSADTCVSPNATSTSFADSVSFIIHSQEAANLTNGGIGYWTQSCTGLGLPALFTGTTGDILIDVQFLPATVSNTSTGGCGAVEIRRSPTGELTGGTITIFGFQGDFGSCSHLWEETMAHEIGHVLGLANSSCLGYMMGPPHTSFPRSPQAGECTQADTAFFLSTETPDEPIGSDPQQVPPDPSCEDGCSPIVVGLEPGAFRFTSVAEGTHFDIDADGIDEPVSWLEPGRRQAFLALDRDENGSIDDGSELFGEVTPQPAADGRNGFLALEEFDRGYLGGDQDGRITSADRVFELLRLWHDLDHDGHSQPHELTSLSDEGIVAIDLALVRSSRRDRHGNELRWVSRVHFEHGSRLAAADVILLVGE